MIDEFRRCEPFHAHLAKVERGIGRRAHFREPAVLDGKKRRTSAMTTAANASEDLLFVLVGHEVRTHEIISSNAAEPHIKRLKPQMHADER